MASLKRCISLKEDLMLYAEDISSLYFQDNLSMFLGYLISCHKAGAVFEALQLTKDSENKC